MLRYSQIEAAIAKTHNIPDRSLKTFRSRIRNFQRIGLVPNSPGKGQKISYSLQDAIMWAFCIELADAGLTPLIIKALYDFQLPMAANIVEQQEISVDFFLYISPRLLGLSRDQGGLSSGYEFGYGDVQALAHALTSAENAKMFIINLRIFQSRLLAALDEVRD